MIGPILNAVLKECRALLAGDGSTVMLRTNFLKKGTPDNPGNFLLLDFGDAPDSVQYPGGLTRMDWRWGLNAYNYEPDAYVDDETDYSADLLNYIDKVRVHFELGPLGNGIILPAGQLIPGKIYKAYNGEVIYNNATYVSGQPFTCLPGITTYTSLGGYALGTSWLTQAMADVFFTYGFQFTMTGVLNADPVDEQGLIMGFKIQFDSTAFDGLTLFTYNTHTLDTITQIENPPFDPWILATNFWNDKGVWKDTSHWQD